MVHVNYNDLTPTEAVAIQKELREKIKLGPLQKPVTTVAGADISFNKYSETVYAGIVVLSFPNMQVLHTATTITSTKFPYIPGLLAFREVPALMEVWGKLEIKPDVLILDGHGIAHPRRVGIATHFGLAANTPTIGCAKSLLTGGYEEPDASPLSTSPLIDKQEQIGTVLRTKNKCKPVYVSPGHLITMQESLAIIKQCIRKHRIPEPTRLAHLLVNEIRIKNKS